MTMLETEKEINFDEIFSVEKKHNHHILKFNENFKNLIIFDPGLYHTAICKSKLCKIDKKTGELFYRGENAKEKISEDFLDVAYFILFGNDTRKEEFKNYVFHFSKLLPEQKRLLDAIQDDCHPMETLSMSIIGLNCLEKKYLKNPNDLVEKAAFIIAQVATTIAYRYVKYNNNLWIDDHLDMPYSQQILFRMHAGKNVERLIKLGKILNTIMILHAEHGQNCSAATVRNIASARGSIYTAVASGMSAFNGKIHGGASQEVSQMYDDILKNNIDIEAYVNDKINKKELLMGFGQRTYNIIYNCWDPRVETMYKILTEPSFDFEEVNSYKKIALGLINVVKNNPFFSKRNLTPNPDLFNCIFFKLFGAYKEMNTTMLALGRITGWIANFIEHTKDLYPLTRPCDLN